MFLKLSIRSIRLSTIVCYCIRPPIAPMVLACLSLGTLQDLYQSSILIIPSLGVCLLILYYSAPFSLILLQDKLTLEELQFSDGERLAAEREVKKG